MLSKFEKKIEFCGYFTHGLVLHIKKNKSVEPVNTWQSIFEMTNLGSEATIIRLHANFSL